METLIVSEEIARHYEPRIVALLDRLAKELWHAGYDTGGVLSAFESWTHSTVWRFMIWGREEDAQLAFHVKNSQILKGQPPGRIAFSLQVRKIFPGTELRVIGAAYPDVEDPFYGRWVDPDDDHAVEQSFRSMERVTLENFAPDGLLDLLQDAGVWPKKKRWRSW